MKRSLLLALFPLLAAVSQAEVDFAHQVVPVLRKHCADCHMGMAKKGGFSMNTRESFLAGSEDGAIVEPGKSADSILMDVLRSNDKKERMPPKGDRVPEKDIEILRQWIDGG
ncbi:MAG TPA: c-type cytochrome domain-containing protein, partial [Luteolibacter sp.]|nr:c-type cytochrome domain-containing protein [Luteolibacter sp.]